MSTDYKSYWSILLREGKLTLQMPTVLVNKVRHSISNSKYDHRLRSGIRYSNLKTVLSPAKTASGAIKPGWTRVDFSMHNVTLKDF